MGALELLEDSWPFKETFQTEQANQPVHLFCLYKFYTRFFSEYVAVIVCQSLGGKKSLYFSSKNNRNLDEILICSGAQ